MRWIFELGNVNRVTSSSKSGLPIFFGVLIAVCALRVCTSTPVVLSISLSGGSLTPTQGNF